MELLSEIFVANVRALLKQRDLTQAELSRMSRGVLDKATISNAMNGRNTTLKTMALFAQTLEVELWQLMIPPQSPVIEFVRAWESADPQGRDLIQQIVQRELVNARLKR